MTTKKEVRLNAENNRQAICDAIGNEVLRPLEIEERLNIGEMVIRGHLSTLIAKGYVISATIVNSATNKKIVVYRLTDKKYVAKTQDELDITDAEKKEFSRRTISDIQAMKANPNLRIIRSLDKRVPTPKQSRKFKHTGVSSSFPMWDLA
jgi:predicted ArsR family transcriptional regulator